MLLISSIPLAPGKLRSTIARSGCNFRITSIFFFFNDTATTEIYTLSLHDALPINRWYAHWVTVGFEAVEPLLKPGPYAVGAAVGLADSCLVPQGYNARRFNVPLDRFPNIVAVAAACLKLPAFDQARPENQPDAE